MTTLTVELADEQMQVLERAAQQRGLSVPALMAAIAAQYTAAQTPLPEYDVTQDPLFNIKAHDSAAPEDLSCNVDHYLYGAAKR